MPFKRPCSRVLRVAGGSLRVAEIHGRVEEKLGRVVSRDTVASHLSVACRADDAIVVRVARGAFYMIGRCRLREPASIVFRARGPPRVLPD